MRYVLGSCVAMVVLGSAATLLSGADDRAVVVAHTPADRRVDVSIGGQPFTAYLYPASLEKPVLYPTPIGARHIGDARLSAAATAWSTAR